MICSIQEWFGGSSTHKVNFCKRRGKPEICLKKRGGGGYLTVKEKEGGYNYTHFSVLQVRDTLLIRI